MKHLGMKLAFSALLIASLATGAKASDSERSAFKPAKVEGVVEGVGLLFDTPRTPLRIILPQVVTVS
ncbi:hypothetical protein ACFQ14_07410 [Pseudahrensia aquimaris]|uniref:Uncharacterized protein n=1 Tax=Pseudahrensia aquimaris TaxID=744461 RepID=A0ABW3FEP9_9HYPH